MHNDEAPRNQFFHSFSQPGLEFGQFARRGSKLPQVKAQASLRTPKG
jgi:hypothetical protein